MWNGDERWDFVGGEMRPAAGWELRPGADGEYTIERVAAPVAAPYNLQAAQAANGWSLNDRNEMQKNFSLNELNDQLFRATGLNSWNQDRWQNSTVDPSFTQDQRFAGIESGKYGNTLKDYFGLAKGGALLDLQPGAYANGIPEMARWLGMALNAPNEKELIRLSRKFHLDPKNVTNQSGPDWTDEYLLPGVIGAMTGGALTGLTLPTASALAGGAAFTPSFAGGALSGLANTLTGQVASSAAGQAAGAAGSAAAGSSGVVDGGAAAAAAGGPVYAGEFDGLEDAFDAANRSGLEAGDTLGEVEPGWNVNPSTAPLDWSNLNTTSVTGQLPLNSFPGQSATLAGTLASLGVTPAQAASTGIGAANAANGANNATTPAANGSALSRILDGTATTADYTQVLGGVGAAGLGAFGAIQQANAFRDLAEKARADRAPFLAKANEWMANPDAYYAGPGKSSLNAVLRGLSVNGNPFGNATSLALATEAGMRDWRGAVTGFGNMGLAGEDTRAQLGSNAINSDAGVWNAIGGGIADVTRPRNSLTDLYRQLRTEGLV